MILTESFGVELYDIFEGSYAKWSFYNRHAFQGGDQYQDHGLGAISATVRDTRIETINARVPGGRYITMYNNVGTEGVPQFTRQLDAPRTTVFMACAYNNSPPYVSDSSIYGFGAPNYDSWIMSAASADGTSQIHMGVSGLNLYVGLPSGDLFTLATPIVQARWHYLELGIHISATAGWVEARLDGVLGGAYYGSTGTSRATANGNTVTGATPNIGSLSFGAPSQPFTGCFADVVAMDDANVNPLRPNNDFLGNKQVVLQVPSGVGAHSDFLIGGTSPAATTWQSVSISPMGFDVVNIEGMHAGDISTFQMTQLPAFTQEVFAIAPFAIGEKAAAGARRGSVVVRWPGDGGGAVDFPLLDVILQNTYVRLEGGCLGVNLADQPWGVTETNSLEIGIQVTT